MAKKSTLKNLSTNNGKVELTEDDLSFSLNFQIKNKIVLTSKQKEILKTAHKPETKCYIMAGLSGVSKTFLAMLIALEKLRDGEIDKIVCFRSTIQSQDGETGFLKGEIDAKMQYFVAPYEQKLSELLDCQTIKAIKKENLIEYLPTSALRGLSFRNTCIILSESQNCFLDTIIDAAARAGEGCYVIIEGDDELQNDIGRKSGFKEFVELFSEEDSQKHGIEFTRFTEDDIVRSNFTKFIITKYKNYITNKS